MYTLTGTIVVLHNCSQVKLKETHVFINQVMGESLYLSDIVPYRSDVVVL